MKSLSFQSLSMHDNSNLIEQIHQSFIDLENSQDEEDVQRIFEESKKHLDKKLQIDILNELFSIIISCFKRNPKELLPFFEELLANSKFNENYILLTSMILAYLVVEQPLLQLPDYNSFVSDTLNEILPQIQNEKTLILYGQSIPIQFKNDLIINLLLSSKLTEKLILDFFPFLFSTNFSIKNKKFDLLLKSLMSSGIKKIFPPTETFDKELFEFINSKDFQLILKMNKESFSLIESAILFTKSEENFEIEGLSKETVLPFLAVVLIFTRKLHRKTAFSSQKLSELFINVINDFEILKKDVSIASFDAIIGNFFELGRFKIITKIDSFNILKTLIDQLLNGKYLASKTVLLTNIFQFSNWPINDEIRNFFNENGIGLINYLIKNIHEYDDCENLMRYKLNLSMFQSEKISDLIQSSQNEIETFYFIENFCVKQPNLKDSNEFVQHLIDIAKKRIEDKNWNDFLLVYNFLKRNNFNDAINDINQLNLPLNIKQQVCPFTPKEDECTIDELIDIILCRESPETDDHIFKILFDKLMQNDDLLHMYLSLFAFKYSNKEYDVSIFLKTSKKEFEKYGDKFINAANKAYFLNEKEKVLLRNPDFSIYSLNVPELGTSIVTKLFKSIESNPKENYQAFFCLKNIASTFLMIFKNRHDEIFELVLQAFDGFQFILKENNKNLKLIKTAYSAFSFFLSVSQMPIIYDKFIVWFNENMASFSNAQIYGFINIINILISEFMFNYSLIIWSQKINIMENIGKLLKREINDDLSFMNMYKESIYNLIKNYYEKIKEMNKYELIQIEEFIKLENPLNYISSITFLIYPWSFLGTNLTVKNISSSMSFFMKETDRYRDYWLIYPYDKMRVSCVSENQIEYFINNYGESKFNKDNYNIPKMPVSYSIEMTRYLVLKPLFIYSYFLYKNPVKLVPPYYELICRTNNDLRSIQNENDYDIESYDGSDFLLNFYCQQDLLKDLIDQISLQSLNISNFDLLSSIFQTICNNEVALLSILEFLCQKLNDTYINDIFYEKSQSSLIINRIINILKSLTKKKGFIENFFDLCGNRLLEIALSSKWRTDSSLLIELSNFLLNYDSNLPIRVSHLIPFLIISKEEKAVSSAIKLYSKFKDHDLTTVDELILDYFDSECQKQNTSPSIIEIIKNVPILKRSRRLNLIEIIDKLLNNYSSKKLDDESIIDFISNTMNTLVPERNNSISRTSISSESKIPESIRENSPIFWDVFEKHCQFFYDLLNQNALYLDKFTFLLHYPELLSFSIRSSYFKKKMKSRLNRYSNCRLNIDRNNLLTSSFRCFQKKSTDDLLKTFDISFQNERGIDDSGLTRDWFTDLAKEIFNQNYGLFDCCGSNKSYKPSSLSYINSNHLEYFKFAGKFIACALLQSQCIDAHLTTSFWKQILHRKPDMNDLEEIDEEIYQSLQYMKNNDVDSLEMVFAVNKDELGIIKTIPLKENGEEIFVTNENKNEYISLRADYLFKGVIEDQVNSFCEGFNSLISHNDVKIFTPSELDLLVCGIPVIDIDDFKRNTVFGDHYSIETPVIKMFFNVISKWDNEKLAKLLLFMTGSSRVPSNGFKEFCEMTGRPLKISPGGPRKKLPQSHTCYNVLCLPEYENEDELNEKLSFAIQNTNTFELA